MSSFIIIFTLIKDLLYHAPLYLLIFLVFCQFLILLLLLPFSYLSATFSLFASLKCFTLFWLMFSFVTFQFSAEHLKLLDLCSCFATFSKQFATFIFLLAFCFIQLLAAVLLLLVLTNHFQLRQIQGFSSSQCSDFTSQKMLIDSLIKKRECYQCLVSTIQQRSTV